MLIKVKKLKGFEQYIRRMLELKSTDFFLVPGEPPAFRVDGQIVREEDGMLDEKETRRLVKRAFGGRQFKRLGSELGILRGTANASEVVGFEHGAGQRIVIAAGCSQDGYTIAGRMVPGQIPTPETIGMPQAVLDAANSPFGLIIFTGPTGSGKTTAAASVLDYLNASGNRHICLLGDPVEFVLEPKQAILQNRDLGLDMPDFISGMTAALAQDVDVVYLSEIRSVEELKMALMVAHTGHLVVTVLHAHTAAGAIRRIIDILGAEQGTSKADIAAVLRCVTALKLLPKAEGRGRVAAYEVLVPDSEMRTAISENRDFMDRDELPDGCVNLKDSVSELLKNGSVTQEAADNALAEL